MKVGLLGNFGSGNVGNEASMDAVRTGLERIRPDLEFVCLCPRPAAAAALHGVPALSLRRPRPDEASRTRRHVMRAPRFVADVARAVGVVRRLDLVAVPGTSILDDFGDGPTGMPYDLAVWTMAARIARRPFHFVAVGAGPIQQRASRALLALAARLATGRTYRDQGSRDFMASVGLDVADDRVVADVVFGVEPPARTIRLDGVEGPVVGLGVMVYRGWATEHPHAAWLYSDYLERSAELIRRLARCGTQIHLLTAEDADQTAVEGCLDLLDPDTSAAVTVVPTPRCMEELTRAIADVDVVAAPRFHMVLTSLIVGVPPVSIGYASRNRDLLDRAGLGTFCHSIESFDPVAVAGDIGQLLRRRHELAPRLDEWSAEQRAIASNEVHKLAEVLR